MKRAGFAVCLRNEGFTASLEVRKLYPVLNDSTAAANDLICVVDESGEDYLYAANLFRQLSLPADLQRSAPRFLVHRSIFSRSPAASKPAWW